MFNSFLLFGPLSLLMMSHAFGSPPRVAFVLYDAGETKALVPVMDELDTLGVSYDVLVMATARSLTKGHSHLLDINKDCGVKVDIDSSSWPRDKRIGIDDLARIEKCLSADNVLITGVFSMVQSQIARMELKHNHKVFGFYDSLSNPSSRFNFKVSLLLAPSRSVAQKLKEVNPQQDVKVVGQPTLDIWAKAKTGAVTTQVKQTLAHFKASQKTLLYVGGYGATYDRAFALFAQVAQKLPHWNVVVSLHPKSDGSLERKGLGNLKNVTVLSKSISTMDAALVADLIVTQRSSVGSQALFMGKPVVYLDVPGSTYKDFAIENGFIPQITSVDKFLEHVETKFLMFSRGDMFLKFGVPRESAKIIANTLIQ